MSSTRVKRHSASALAFAVLAALLLASTASMAQSLLVNSGFETNGAGWGKFGNVDFVDWAKETEEFGAAMQGWVLNAAGGFFQSVKGTPGQEYKFSIRAKKESMFQASNVFVKIEFYLPDDTTKAGHDQGTVNVASTLTTDWQTITITGKAPLNTAFVRPVFGFDGATKGDLGQGKQACFFDNAELTLGP